MNLPMHLRPGFKIPPLRLLGSSEPIYLKTGRGKSKVVKLIEPAKPIKQPVAAKLIDLRLSATPASQIVSAPTPSLLSPDCNRYRRILVVGKVLTGAGLMATPITFG